MIASMLVLVVAAMVGFLGFQAWARRREAGPVPARAGRVSLLTEAVAYVGAILVIAGGATAIGQRWSDISDWGHVGVLAGAAVLFLVAGTLVRHVAEPAIQRLVSVLWFVSVGGFAAAVGLLAGQVVDLSDQLVVLDIGLATVAYAGVLWWLRRQVLQHVAVFAGLIVTATGTVATLAGGEPPRSRPLWRCGPWAWAGPCSAGGGTSSRWRRRCRSECCSGCSPARSRWGRTAGSTSSRSAPRR